LNEIQHHPLQDQGLFFLIVRPYKLLGNWIIFKNKAHKSFVKKKKKKRRQQLS